MSKAALATLSPGHNIGKGEGGGGGEILGVKVLHLKGSVSTTFVPDCRSFDYP